MATSVRPQTTVRDTILSTLSPDLTPEAVDAVEDVTLSSTEAACLSSHELLDWDEYRGVRL